MGQMTVSAPATIPMQLLEIDPAACRALWCAVVIENWNVAVAPSSQEHSLDIHRCRDWFGCPDFHRVCEMAGLDGDDLLVAYRAARAPGAGFRLALQKQAVWNQAGGRAE
ncbi:hypothetical protein [Paracoccus litorisediminis]|uniref:hypothetical protein n=1 Tax=Paracoccus litorisediminis TaxID=2006130 RepID=UPI003736B0DA